MNITRASPRTPRLFVTMVDSGTTRNVGEAGLDYQGGEARVKSCVSIHIIIIPEMALQVCRENDKRLTFNKNLETETR